MDIVHYMDCTKIYVHKGLVLPLTPKIGNSSGQYRTFESSGPYSLWQMNIKICLLYYTKPAKRILMASPCYDFGWQIISEYLKFEPNCLKSDSILEGCTLFESYI